MADELRTTDIVSEISSIMGWDRDEVQREVDEEVMHPGSHVKNAWNEAAPTQPGDVESFYSKTNSYILDLMVESEREVRQQWRQAVVDTLDNWWGGAAGAAVLDYGGGVGTDTLFFAQKCRSAAYYDLPGNTSDFAMQRFNRRGTGIARITKASAYTNRFDALVSFEVLEHLLDPAAHLDEMVHMTKTGGLLFLTESFELVTEDYPSHLPSNKIYTGQLDGLMRGRGCQPVALLEDRIHVYVKGPSVTVAVPVYNAYDHVTRLLESIQTTTAGYPVSWLFINDASPDTRISALLQEFDSTFDGTSRVIERAENRGFPMTANEAMKAAGTDDVVLLNSDTILYDGWLRRLAQAAYSDPTIGTVTPLSNSASVYSVFKHITVDNRVNDVLSEMNLPMIDIPVGVGFCLYIKREVLNRVGYFDPIFGKGYGEETDLCLRAAKIGYRHVLAPTVFIYHAGSASMLDAGVVNPGASTIEEHEHIVVDRYPTFESSVHTFIASGVIPRLERRVANRYITGESASRPSIGIVIHDDVFSRVIGGITEHLRDMIHELGSEFIFYIFTPVPDDSDRVIVTALVDGVRTVIKASATDYAEVIAELNPSLIHIHHLILFSNRFISALTNWSGPKFYTIHDYFGVCNQYLLLNYKNQFCNVPGPKECGACARALFRTDYAEVLKHREVFQQLVDSCAKVIAPSAAAMEIFRRAIYVPEVKAQVIPHPVVAQKYRDMIGDPFRQALITVSSISEFTESEASLDAKAPRRGRRAKRAMNGAATSVAVLEPQVAQQIPEETDVKLCVGFIGYNAVQKGTSVVKGIVAACAKDPIQFVSIGDIGKVAADRPNMVLLGKYARQDVASIIAANKIDVVVIPSVWAETFCFTLSEAWEAGVPVITGPLGAQAERVSTTGAGMALADYNPATFAQALRNLAADRSLLAQMATKTRGLTPRTDYGEYREIYLLSSGGHIAATRLFSSVDQSTSGTGKAELSIPIVDKLVRMRKSLFPVGSARERMYFFLHNLVTSSYARSW